MLGAKSLFTFTLLSMSAAATDADADAPVAFAEQQVTSLFRANPTPAPTLTGNADSVAEIEKIMREYAAKAAAGNPVQQQQDPSKPAKRCTIGIPNERLVDMRCDSDRIRFIGLGDWGEITESPGVLAVRDGVMNVTDRQWQTTWTERFRVGSGLTLPWISFLGNHDHYGKIAAQIEFGLSSQPGAKYWIMPSKSYSIDAKVKSGEKVKLVVADTHTLNWAADAAWLTQEYTDPKAKFVIAAGHHHIYSAGGLGDNSTASAVALNKLIQSTANVKCYLAGHEHDMQFVRAAEKDYFLFGGGGRGFNSTEKRPGTAADTVFYAKKYGYALFDVHVATRIMRVTYRVFNTTGHEDDEVTFTRRY